MKSSVSLLSIIMALCLGHVLARGLEEEKKTFSVDLEVINPWHDCLKQLGNNNNNNNNNNTRKCDVDLFGNKKMTLEKSMDNSYILTIGIGSGKRQQNFKVLLDTSSSRLWVLGMKYKDSKDSKLNKYNPAKSDTYKDLKLDFVSKHGGRKVTGDLVKDTITLAKDFEAVEQTFGTASSVSKQMTEDGVLGLSMSQTWGDNPVITAMEDAKMAPIFSLYLMREEKDKYGGQITFGGVSEDLLKMGTQHKVDVLGCGRFILQMDEVKFGKVEMCSKKGKVYCRVLIDSSTSLIKGPKGLIDDFNKKELGVNPKDVVREVKCEKRSTAPAISIMFGERTLKLEASYYIVKVVNMCFSMLIGEDDDEGRWIFGVPFLHKFVTEYNVKRGNPSVTFYEVK